MQDLPDDGREIVRLRYFENRTLPQIAQHRHQNLALDAGVWLMKRSMKHLKLYLRDE